MQNPVGFATARAGLLCKLTGIARQACLRNAPAGAVTVPELKAIPHNSRLTAQAPLRRLRHGICVAKMLDNVGLRYPHRTSGTKAPRTLRPLPLLALTFAASSIICAFGLAAAAPCSPYRHLELCGIALKAGLTIPNFYFLTPTCFYRSKEILYASCNQDQPQG